MRSGHPPTRHSSLPLKPEMKFFEWELQGLMPIPTAWWKGTFIQKSQNSTWSPGGFTCEYVQMHMNRQKKNAKNKQTALGKKRTPNIIKPQHVENHWQHWSRSSWILFTGRKFRKLQMSHRPPNVGMPRVLQVALSGAPGCRGCRVRGRATSTFIQLCIELPLAHVSHVSHVSGVPTELQLVCCFLISFDHVRFVNRSQGGIAC